MDEDLHCPRCGEDNPQQFEYQGAFASSKHWVCRTCWEKFTTRNDHWFEDGKEAGA